MRSQTASGSPCHSEKPLAGTDEGTYVWGHIMSVSLLRLSSPRCELYSGFLVLADLHYAYGNAGDRVVLPELLNICVPFWGENRIGLSESGGIELEDRLRCRYHYGRGEERAEDLDMYRYSRHPGAWNAKVKRARFEGVCCRQTLRNPGADRRWIKCARGRLRSRLTQSTKDSQRWIESSASRQERE